MATNSTIEWTEATWNAVTGCTKISAGCLHCYAERMTARLRAMAQPNYRNGFQVTVHPDSLNLPLRWRKPQTIFVNSMSDLFHEAVPEKFIRDTFAVMERTPWHCFQILTKRPKRLVELASTLPWPPHIWMGVTVEATEYTHRIRDLAGTPAAIKFLSLEPMLGPMPNLNLNGIDWVIVGGESGPGARPMHREWAVDVCLQCQRAGIPFFFKQWGGARKKAAGRLLDGRTWDEMPHHPRR